MASLLSVCDLPASEASARRRLISLGVGATPIRLHVDWRHMRAAYTGHEALTFGDYIDLETGRTLLAEPGGVYDIAPASGRNVDEIPAPWFVLATPVKERATLKAVPLAPPEPAPESLPSLVDEG
jgi:hypothetical protein